MYNYHYYCNFYLTVDASTSAPSSSCMPAWQMKTKKGETGILSFGLHLASLLCLFLVTDVIVSTHIYTSTVNPHELTLSMNIYIYIFHR